jgi:hypothetical protein
MASFTIRRLTNHTGAEVCGLDCSKPVAPEFRDRLNRVSNDEFVNGRRIIPGETFHTDHSNHPRPPKATMVRRRAAVPRRRHPICQHASGL